jgi:2-C-methyl-D-erythritol 4-phosphate cytidylyltransferase
LAGQAVVAHTLQALAAVPALTATLVVLSPDDTAFERQAPAFAGWVARSGGATRADSVAAGLLALRGHGALDSDWVLVHDAARCLLRPDWVARLINACVDDAVGGLLALPLADTLKSAQREGGERVASTLDRSHKWLAQTPQMFRLGLLQRALAAGQAAGIPITDESSAVEALGLAPLLVPGDQENLKLTWPADFALAARLLETR